MCYSKCVVVVAAVVAVDDQRVGSNQGPQSVTHPPSSLLLGSQVVYLAAGLAVLGRSEHRNPVQPGQHYDGRR